MPDITQAPTRLNLGGNWYTLDVLADVDIEELTNWLRSDYIQMVRASHPEDMPAAQRDREMRLAFDVARGLSWISGDGAKAMASLRGVARVIWQGLRRNHPELTHDAVQRLICDKATIDYAMRVWKELNVGPATAAAKARGASVKGGPKVSRRSTRRGSSRRTG